MSGNGKVLFALVVAGLLALGAGTAVTAASATTPAPMVHHATLHHVKGEVTAVEPTAKTLTVKAMQGKETMDVGATITDKTAIREGKTTKTLGDIKVGDHVTMTYEKTGTGMVAHAIHIQPAKTTAKKM